MSDSSLVKSSSDIGSISRNTDAPRITEIDMEDQALVLHSQASSSESQTLQRLYPASTSLQPIRGHSSTVYVETENNATHQARLDSLQKQIDKILHETQQIEQLQQQQQQQIEQALQEIQQTNHQMHKQQQQQIEEIHHQMHKQYTEEIQKQTHQHQQHSEEIQQLTNQHQQQIDDILQQVQAMKQDGHQMIQQIHALKQSNRKEASEQQVRREETFQLQGQEFDRLMVIKYRTQALLGTPFQELLIPRLFVVLPVTSSMVDKDGSPCPLLYRLYYLCECGTHTMSESSKGRHEIHMANHPGYDLDNHSTFFDKYGSYLLAMMFMVKYGAVAAGRVVPPLANLRLAGGIDTEKGHLNRQVDDTITYLEDTLCINKNDMDPIQHWEVDHSELIHMKSYLKTMEGQNSFGDLHPTTTQDRQCVWVCNEHQREYHDSIMQQLRKVIKANGGYEEYNKEAGKIKNIIMIRSDALTKRFYDALLEVRWIQNADNQWYLTALDLKLGYDRLITTSIAHILVNLNNMESLELDFRQVLLTIGTSPDGTGYMKIEMGKFKDLTHDDFEFVHECHNTRLTIRNTPQEVNDYSLISTLQRSTKLEFLRIRCLANRASAVINLITSTREKTLLRGEPVSLRTFELMDEDLVTVDISTPWDDHHIITTTLKFTEDSEEFEMRTRIGLGLNRTVTKDDSVRDFIQHYGWTIEILKSPSVLDDHLVSLLHNSIRERGSQIIKLSIVPSSLTKAGLDTLDQIIRISPNLVSLQLWFNKLEDAYQLEKALLLLERYKERLEGIGFYGDSIATWLPQIIKTYPNKNSFPKMNSFGVQSNFPRNCTEWVTGMISVPLQPSPSNRLNGFSLYDVTLRPEDWQSVIDAIDLAELDWLHFFNTNFTHKELELLINRIVAADMQQVKLRTLRLGKEMFGARPLYAKLREKLPHIIIE
ncbi:hypothetical protein BGZ65_005972 [Modicella reniformis]|uniref:Uncharacterized protein n=1 Tax=Modicella reniformis TaxID=1440133 RepID=A0A9P6JHI7_9FUNG|nr:hypothetical protein BGZ65_005972 [Modicella reniformis]